MQRARTWLVRSSPSTSLSRIMCLQGKLECLLPPMSPESVSEPSAHPAGATGSQTLTKRTRQRIPCRTARGLCYHFLLTLAQNAEVPESPAVGGPREAGARRGRAEQKRERPVIQESPEHLQIQVRRLLLLPAPVSSAPARGSFQSTSVPSNCRISQMLQIFWLV